MSTFTLAKTRLLTAFLLLLTYAGKSQLHANFTATPTSGCSPLVVNFTDQSTGNPTQWRWDLGNGTISFLQNPSATYFTPGTYNIKLVVKNASGSDSLTRSQYITIYANPVVDFSASPTSGCFPLPVQFTDLSTSANSTINQWQWDFGDGTFGTTQNPMHVYTAAGNYNVSLVVTNNQGCSKNITKVQYIQVAPGVHADFTNTVPNRCTPPVNIDFQNLSTGAGALSYQWNFGDGGTSILSDPSHNYTTAGSYTVQLIVTNSNGCRDTITKPNAVTVGATTTGFSAPDSSCVGTAIPFNNTSTPVPASVLWTFGDGTTSTDINPVKTYTIPGTYHVKLVNNFGACMDSITKTIVISPLPVVNFTSVDTVACQAPFTVHFTNTSTGGVTYQWLFGDGGTSNQANPTHTYTTPGVYNVRLIVTNSFGCTNNIIKQGFVKIVLPVATIDQLPQRGCAPFDWTFSSTVVTSEPITNYQWDFGDGTTSTLPTPTHTFTAGTYTITLIVSTASGCRDTVRVTQGIRAGNKPHANFTATPRDACANTAVAFNDLSTGVIDEWLWDFGDGGTSTQQNPSHEYGDTGYFHVQLIVWSNGCPDTIKFMNYIHIKPPIARFVVASNCDDPLKRTFTDQSIGADTWDWDFGDGNTSNIQSPVHVYAASGTYTASLTVTNFSTGCSYVSDQSIRVINEQINFTATDTTLCRNNQSTFTATGMHQPNISSFNWNFGDGGTGTGYSVQHTYTASGVYDVTLITTDLNGCIDTLVKPHYIHVNGPTANFGVSASAVCILSAINFTDSSATDGTHPITQWIWNYGDGVTETLTVPPFQHLYNTPGVYSVTLTVVDATGCMDSIVRPSLVTISHPTAGFSAVDSLLCPGANIQFLNSSTGNALTYKWYFGDGGFSINANPIHAYATSGLYTVKLVVTDQYGCTDSITRTDYIHIVLPVANFTVSDSIGTCPPLIVSFTNTSQYFTSFHWDFGDGTSTNNVNPSHFYNIPGVYHAVLTVTGPGGCTDTKQQTITVRGPYGAFTYTPLEGCTPLTVNFTATTHNNVSFVWDFDDGNTLATHDSIVSHTYTTIGGYIPKMILSDAAGCTVAITGTDTVHVHGVIADMTFAPPIVCDAGSVIFTNTSTGSDAITAYEWRFGDGGTSTNASPSHFYASPGLYYPFLKVTTGYGCSDSVTSTVPVKIVASPQAQIARTNNGCVPVTVTFTGSLVVPDTSAITWQWNFANGNTSTLANPPAQIYATAGNYTVDLIATNSTGCADTVQVVVEAYAIPAVNAGADTLICKGTGRTIQATGADSYSWTPSTGLSCTNCANPVANPDINTTYSVTGTTVHGCSSTDDIFVKVKYPFSMTASKGDTLCKGNTAQLYASGANTYVWSPASGLDNPSSSTPKASPSQTTNYQVIGTDENRCFSDTVMVPVTVYNIPTVEAGADRTINVGQTLDLVPQVSPDVTEALWTPTGSIFRSDFPSISIKPKETTTYVVEVKNRGKCTARDVVTVYVLCNDANVFIPNTFSPNGDGANDVFYPRGKGLFTIKSAKVFNRWGEVMYEKYGFQANNPADGWNGTYKGQKLTPDVFVYVFEIVCDNNSTLVYKGNVALIR